MALVKIYSAFYVYPAEAVAYVNESSEMMRCIIMIAEMIEDRWTKCINNKSSQQNDSMKHVFNDSVLSKKYSK